MRHKRNYLFIIISMLIVLSVIKMFWLDSDVDKARSRLAELGIKANGNSLLEFVDKDSDVVRLLLESGVSPNTTEPQVDQTSALIAAALEGNLKSVQLLVQAGAEVNYETQFGNSNDINAITAVTLGTIDRLCADRDKWKEELADRTKIVQLLLSAGAKPNVPRRYNNVPIVGASCGGMTEAVRELLSNGADVNRASGTGETALISASGNGYADTVEVLLQAGAKLDAQNKYGWTALMAAAKLGNEEVVKLLLKYGANTKIRNLDEKDALDLASARGHEKIVELIGGPAGRP